MQKLLGAIVFALASAVLLGQQFPLPTFLNPNFLYAGGGPASLSFFNQYYRPGLTALWNGSPRATSQDSIGRYVVALTASDLAEPQLAQITMVDARSGAVVDNFNCPVGYNVVPRGVAFDRSRNRLYVATPPQPGDPRFPGNAVVAVDVMNGKIGPILQTDGALGDLALSDDGATLYVVIEGANIVRRIDTATLTATGDFYFRPAGYKGPYPNSAVTDMITVMPGKPNTVALAFSPDVGYSNTEVSIYDNGVKRPNKLVGSGFSSMLFSPDGRYFFQSGYTTFFENPNAFGYQPVTARFLVDSTGIPDQKPPFASGGGSAVIVGGTLYTSLATTIDYEAMQVTGNFGIGGAITVDSANQRAFILYGPPVYSSNGDSFPVELVAFALPSLEPLGSQAVGVSSIPSLNDSEKLIRFGVDGVIIASTAGLLIYHTPLAGPAPVTAANAIANAASQQAGPIGPGEIVTIYGLNLGPSTPQVGLSNAGVFPFSLGNVRVMFGRLPGTMLLASQGQINVVAPFELQPGTLVDIQVLYFGIPSAKISLPVVAAAPALFTRNGSGAGPVAVVNQDLSINTPSPPGSVVSVYGTGGGMDASAVDGAVARHASSLAATVRVSVAGRDAQVLYAGAAPSLVNGAFQINVLVPADTPPGPASIIVNIGGRDSPKGATLEIR